MPKLILLRHGQSLWNLENRFTGEMDIDLTSQMSQKYTVLQKCSCGEEALGQDPPGVKV